MAAPPGAALAETHSAVVMFVGDHAYKLKKPVNLGFLDFTTRSAREAACHREVELNRRLAPDVYLGVADVRDPSGAPCDHLVVMRRMPADLRLSQLVTTGHDVDDDLRHLAHLLAAFHARAEHSPTIDETASAAAMAVRWLGNTNGLGPYAGRFVDAEQIAHVHRLALRYLDGRGPLFDKRITDGRACDGHGDLLADDIFCLDDGPRVLDCIEFDDRLRYGDSLADVAFLAMDLERLGRTDLADRFLAAYREHAADTWPASLAHHHIAYRAQVRAKVAAIRADQGDDDAVKDAPRLLDLAHRHLRDARVRLVLVGGLPGTGKSTLAAGLGNSLDVTVLRSDEIRKELCGIGPDEPAPAAFGEGIYNADITARTYQEMLARAHTALTLGETVVLDASWHDQAHRAQAATLAADTSADLYELHCEAPDTLAQLRMRTRAAHGGDPSDATPDIHAAMRTTAAPWSSAVSIVTFGDPATALHHALEVVNADPLERPAETRNDPMTRIAAR